jgi:hypothetical protein
MDQSVVYTYTVAGHNDGLKFDPVTHLLWALQNEDANPNLAIINTETHERKLYTFGPTLHGGGYDDMTFRACKVYISASNPANNPNTGPGIVSARLEGNLVAVEPVLAAEASAINIPTDATLKLNLQDPDSMTLDPLGNIVLDSQADQELIIVSDPDSSHQRVLRLPLSYLTPGGPMSVETDDTAFITSTEGFLLFADKGLNAVYKISKNAFSPGTAFTAADGGPFVGTLDLTRGVVTPVVTGLKGPGGMAFVDTSKHDRSDHRDDHRDDDRDRCHDRDWDSH